ncbi:MAG: tetratricopeptide repeat protein [Methylobacter sp.]|nr:tetratricopeptide repeat protein [Methylobacter sp.]
MEPERLLSAGEEEQWQELSRHVEWAERFSLIVLFVEDALLAESFKQRLQSQLQGRVSQLHVLRPLHPETLTQDIFNELQHTLIPHVVVPCWLELHHHRSTEWQQALDNFFARFNERRDLIRRDYPRPFIILLPLAYKSRLREIAPDLWSIRSHTDELRPAKVTPTPRVNYDRIAVGKVEQPITINEQALTSPEIREWERVRHTAIADSELFLVTGHAFDAALDSGQWTLAETLAGQLISLSHKMIKDQGETDLTLYQLVRALSRLGEIEQALGRYDEAYQAYAERLQICRELKTSLGASAEVLRDLGVSLVRIAEIDETLGRYDNAFMGYTESLQIFRELKASLGASPQVLRDLSVSLAKVADINTILGHYESALKGYTESLQICRELKVRLGATPEVLRDLSVALEKLANIDKTFGRYEEAFAGYTESLQIDRELKTRLGATLNVLRDLSVSLEKVADIDTILGRYESALAGYTESLQIRRDLKVSLGATPQVLRDLSVAFENLADIDKTLGHYEEACAGYTESLQIRRELQASLGATPKVLQDLSGSLENLADCENSLRHYDEALAAYRECLPLLERLQAALSHDQYSERIAEIKAKISALEQTAQ